MILPLVCSSADYEVRILGKEDTEIKQESIITVLINKMFLHFRMVHNIKMTSTLKCKIIFF